MKLTDDDVAILKHVYRYRFVRTDDLCRLMEHRTPDRLSRRLTLLFRNEFLDRPFSQIDRYYQGGSQPLVHGLGKRGGHYLKEILGMPIGPTDWRSRNRSYTRNNLDHTLAISHFLIDIELACKKRDDLSYISFDEMLERGPERTRRSSNPMRWPVEVNYYGGRGVIHLIPDAIFGLRRRSPSGSRVAYFFVELDRGTMTITPSEQVQRGHAFLYRATILRKLTAYCESYRAKLHEKQFGITTPRVLFVVSGERRLEAIKASLSEMLSEASDVSPGMFLLISMDTNESKLLDDLLGGR